MKINTSYPKVYDFKVNEYDTMKYICDHGLLPDSMSGLSEAIYSKYLASQPSSKFRTNDLRFHCDFDMEIEGSKHKVFIGFQIVRNYDECTYFLAVCAKNNPNVLIRKFHFDYASPNIQTKKQDVPVFHFQYGGKLTPEMRELALDSSRLESGLSVPRLAFPPINLALLLDMLFCEFRTEETTRITEKPEWRKLIYCNECFISKSFYQSISNHTLSLGYGNNNLIRDFYYGR